MARVPARHRADIRIGGVRTMATTETTTVVATTTVTAGRRMAGHRRKARQAGHVAQADSTDPGQAQADRRLQPPSNSRPATVGDEGMVGTAANRDEVRVGLTVSLVDRITSIEPVACARQMIWTGGRCVSTLF